jgi:hypothetical protein
MTLGLLRETTLKPTSHLGAGRYTRPLENRLAIMKNDKIWDRLDSESLRQPGKGLCIDLND